MSTLSSYAARVAKYDPFTPEQERVVFLKVAQGDARAREQAILHNLRLALSYVQRYVRMNPDVPAEDLIQQANLGIIRAVDKFDVTLGYKFSTFAQESMHYLVVRYLQDRKNLIRVPANKFGKVPELADGNLIGLDAPSPEEDGCIGDMISDGRDAFEDIHTRDFWATVAATLTEREAQVIAMRFRQDMEQAAIGEALGVSKQRVHQIQTAALAKLREAQVA